MAISRGGGLGGLLADNRATPASSTAAKKDTCHRIRKAERSSFTVMREQLAASNSSLVIPGELRPNIWPHLRPLRASSQSTHSICRRKMRMSGLCKVEMSAFMDGRGPHGDGANHFEPTRTGPIESVARGTGEASLASSSSGTAENNRPPGAADAAAD